MLRARLLLASSFLISTVISALTMSVAWSPVVIVRGRNVEGVIYLSGYSLRIFGREAVVRVLESVSTLALALVMGSVFPLVLSAYSLGGLLAGRERLRLHLEVASASLAVTAVNVTILYSLLRAIIAGVLPLLPLKGIVDTLAGHLYLEPPLVVYGPAYALYARILSRSVLGVPGALLISLGLIAAASLPLYEALRLEAEPRYTRGPQ